MSSNLVVTNRPTVIQEANRIVKDVLDAWKKTTETWIGIGKVLHQYQEDKSEHGKKVYKQVQLKLQEKGIGAETLRKLARIGANKILQTNANIERLPASYNKLYEISLLSDSEIKKHLLKNEINPEVSLIELRNLKDKSDRYSSSEITTSNSSKESSKKTYDSKDKKTMIEIKMTESYLANNLDEINEKLLQFKLAFKNSRSVSFETKGLFKRKIKQGDIDE